MKNENEQQQKSLTEQTKKDNNCPVDKINHFDSLMKSYTGLDNYDLFKLLYNKVKEKLPLQYYKGPDPQTL